MQNAFITAIRSAFETSRLSVHILDNDIIYLAERCAVFEDFPRLVGVVVYLYKLLIADREQTVTDEILTEVFIDLIFVKVCALDKKLCIIAVFYHFI